MTALMAMEFGWPVTPLLLQAAGGGRVAAFVCGQPPATIVAPDGSSCVAPGFSERRYVELIVCGGGSAVRIAGLPMNIWLQVEPRVAELSPSQIVEELKLAQQRAELQWRQEREARFRKGFNLEEEL